MKRLTLGTLLILLLAAPAAAQPAAPLPTPAEMAASRVDVWGEAALRQPGGPSYEFFKDLLPPLRYVNTAFRHYPIVLAAPAGAAKARWVSNGSGVNLRADKPPMWREVGVPVSFHVGDPPQPFGAEVGRLDGPRYAGGYLPIVRVGYTAGETAYEQEAFGAAHGPLAERGAVFVRFTVRKGAGRVTARVSGGMADKKGRAVVRHGPGWNWDDTRKELIADLKPGASADLIVLTRPDDGPPAELPNYDAERKACVEVWEALLARGAGFEVPEPRVQDAWRALVVGNYLIANGDRMNYSAGNAYDHLYEGECGDAVRSLMLFGHTADARRMVGPLLDFDRKATRFHVAGHKLQLLTHYHWVTRDQDYLKQVRPKWDAAIALARDSRSADNGLLPKDRYAGDIAGAVLSLNSNAACWRGLRDSAAVLDDLGERDAAAALRKESAAFRETILAAVAKSQDRAAKFIPIALMAGEKPHDPLTATRTGSYYDLMIPYVLGSGVFGPSDEREGWIIDYLRAHGGLAMGMIRSMPHQGEFDKQPGVNPLYGLRYNLTLLRRGDRDHALVGFYGQLAQGMTRDTFVGGEGSRFLHGDRHGRSFYLPPNSASNATFLTTLRYLLVQDWDLDDDGRPETLRLGDALPPPWLADGSATAVRDAPSAFGPVSFRVASRLTQGEIVVGVRAPERPTGRWQLRLPDPPGHRIVGVRIGADEVKRDADGRVDLTGRTGAFDVRFAVRAEGAKR